MASALLVGRDEAPDQPRWGQRKVYMRKGSGRAGSKPGFNPQEVSRARLQSGRLRDEPARVMAGHQMFDAAASDDSSSLNRKSISVNHEARKDAAAATAVGWSNVNSFVTFNVSSYSKQGIRDLKRKLNHELELVRDLYSRIEAREAQLRVGYCQSGGVNTNASYSASQFSGNDVRNYGGKEVTSELASGGTLTPRQGQRDSNKPALQLSLSAIDHHVTVGDGPAAKEKRTPKANQYYRNSEFVMGKDKMPRIYNNSLRYWLLEYLRRQPREKQFRALILRFVKDKMAALLLLEIGLQGSVEIISGAQVGDEIMVHIHEAHPRKEILSLKQVLSS